MRKLEEILKYDQPTKFIVNSDDYNDEFEIPVLTAGKSFLLGFTSETEGVFDRIPAIIFDDFTTSFHYVDFPFKVKSSAMKILTPKTDKVHLKYVFYQMQGLRIDTDLHKRYWISKFSKLQIPQPPLKTQKLIAKILDNAAAVRDKTKQLLEEYDRLVQSIFLEMFGDPAFNIKEYPEIVLEDLVRDKNDIKCGPFGTQLSKSEYVKEGVAVWGIPQVNSNFEKKPTEYVTSEKAKELESYSVKGLDIVMSRKGNVGSCAIYPTLWSSGILHSDVLRIRCDVAKVSPVFLAWQFRLSRKLKTQVDNVSSGAIMAGINVSKLKKISPIIPPIDLQNKFAEKIALIEKQKELIKQELKESEDLFQVLLQKAFKGELVKEKELEIN